MSESATYQFRIADDLIRKIISDATFSFDNKVVQAINIINTDSTVTIILTELVNVKALFISSVKPITVTINGQAISFDDFMFIKVTALASLTIETAETTKHAVEIVLWGRDT